MGQVNCGYGAIVVYFSSRQMTPLHRDVALTQGGGTRRDTFRQYCSNSSGNPAIATIGGAADGSAFARAHMLCRLRPYKINQNVRHHAGSSQYMGDLNSARRHKPFVAKTSPSIIAHERVTQVPRLTGCWHVGRGNLGRSCHAGGDARSCR